MQAYDVYKDISERTGGDIYIGVVGPVRSGKSTFITKMMDQLVLPRIEDDNEKQRITDELPQSGAGRTIMTTQPKFVPGEAIKVNIDDVAELKIRMVDCVGYLIPGAIGQNEGEIPRMVKTPWLDYEIPFEQAAEIGTQKVIQEHATIGVVMTTDGTIASLPRESYVTAEERVVSELKAIGKPFVIVLNSASPGSTETQNLRDRLTEKYGVSVALLDVLNMEKQDVNALLSDILYEFPVRRINYNISKWLCALDEDHWLFSEVLEKIKEATEHVAVMKDFGALTQPFEDIDYIGKIAIDDILLGDGSINVGLDIKQALFYKVLGEECGCEIQDDSHLIEIVKDLVGAKRQYDKLEGALAEVRSNGYGVVQPLVSELTLEEPELIQQGNRFGVRLKASAPSMHIIKVDVQTEVNPIVGTESQSKEFIEYLVKEFEADPSRIWETDIFGKSLYDIVREGLSGKMSGIPEDVREKIQEALNRMVNEGNGGMLCVLL